MEELLNNIVNGTKEIKNKKDLIEANKKELYRLKANKEKFRNNDKSLNPQLKLVYENVTMQMRKLLKQNRELNKEIRDLTKSIIDSTTAEIEAKKSKIDSNIAEIEAKKSNIDNNKTELYRLKSNKEKLRNKDKSLKPELKKLYGDITQNMSKLLKENKQLNEDISKHLKENKQLNEDIKVLEKNIEEIENDNLDWILADKQKVEIIDKQTIEVKVESNVTEEKVVKDVYKIESDKEVEDYYSKQRDEEEKKIKEANEKVDRANKEKQQDEEEVEKSLNKKAKKEISQYETELDTQEKEELSKAIASVRVQREQAKIERENRPIVLEGVDENPEEQEEKEPIVLEGVEEDPEAQEEKEPIILEGVEEDPEEQEEKKPIVLEGVEEEPEKQEEKPLVLEEEEPESEPEKQEEKPIVLEDKEEQKQDDENNDFDLNNVTLNPLSGDYQVNNNILNSRNKKNGEFQPIEHITIAMVENGMTVNTQKVKELLKKAPKEIKHKLLDTIKNGIRIDGKLALGLINNEEQLNKYLEICEKYDDLSLTGSENASARAELAEYLPKIEYSLKDLRKSKIDILRKLRIYRTAKFTKKLYKEFGKGKDAKIKMSLIDKIYFGIANIIHNDEDIFQPSENPVIEQQEINQNDLKDNTSEQEKREQFAQKIAAQILTEEQKQNTGEQIEEKTAEVENEDKDNVK